MKQAAWITLNLLGIMLFFAGCENDLKINAPWKETTVVFGLLDGQEQEHFIKINKAFLGEGNALKFASVFDSVYYKPGILTVQIEEYINDFKTKSFDLLPVYNIPKEEGIFSYPSQVVFRFNPGTKLNPDADYRLSVKNKNSGTEISAKTQVFGQLGFEMPGNTLDALPQKKLTVKWKSVKNGALYEAIVRFTFREIFEKSNQDTLYRYFDFNLGRIGLDYQASMQSLSLPLDCINIYRTLFNELGPSDSSNPVTRIADSLLVRVNVADADLRTYLELNQPSNTLAQERPEFSNISNGIGLFASRGSFLKKFYIKDETVDSLRKNSFTKDLGFMDRD